MVLRVLIPATLMLACCGCEPPAVSTAAKTGPPPPPAVGVQMAEVPVSAEAAEAPLPEIEQPVIEAAPSTSIEPAAPQEPTTSAEPPAAEPAAQTPTAELSPSSPTDSRQPIIRLSAGVALPQLLPEGTQIGVSVDYKVSGRLNGSARYALVVESSAGPIAVPVKLSPEGGTLQGFLPLSVRPEHKPFSARVEELAPGSRRSVIVSNRLDLQTSY